MGKKKRTQLKPISRGFATTSIPSKKALAETEPATQEEPPSGPNETNAVDVVSAGSSDTQPVSGSSSNVQEQALQELVDKWQEKTEREVGRTLKVCGTSYIAYKTH